MKDATSGLEWSRAMKVSILHTARKTRRYSLGCPEKSSMEVDHAFRSSALTTHNDESAIFFAYSRVIASAMAILTGAGGDGSSAPGFLLQPISSSDGRG